MTGISKSIETILYSNDFTSGDFMSEYLNIGITTGFNLPPDGSKLISIIRNQKMTEFNVTLDVNRKCLITCLRIKSPGNWSSKESLPLKTISSSQTINYNFGTNFNDLNYDYYLWIYNTSGLVIDVKINKITWVTYSLYPNFIILNLSNTSSILNNYYDEKTNKNIQIYDKEKNEWITISNNVGIPCLLANKLLNVYANLNIGIVNYNLNSMSNQMLLSEFVNLTTLFNNHILKKSNTYKVDLILIDTFDYDIYNDEYIIANNIIDNYKNLTNLLGKNTYITNLTCSKSNNYSHMNRVYYSYKHLENVYDNYNVIDVGKYFKLDIKSINRLTEKLLYNYTIFKQYLEDSTSLISYPKNFLDQFDKNNIVDTYIPLNSYLNKIKIVRIHKNTLIEQGTDTNGNIKNYDVAYTNLKISPSGRLMFVNSKLGSTYLYSRNNNSWDYYGLVNTLGNLRLGLMANGLLGLILCENFDENSIDANFRKIFLTYAIDYNDGTRPFNIISSFVYNYNSVNKTHSLDNKTDIWRFNQYFGYAHQVMDGYCHNNKLYVVVGDQVNVSAPQDDFTDAGKIICMDYDGKNKKHVAKGIRDPYGGPIRLPKNIDNLERTVWVGNGNDTARACLGRIDYNLPVLNCGWEGMYTKSFINVPDTNHILPIKPNIVTYSWLDADPSPNGLAMYTLENPFIRSGDYLNTCIPKSIVPQSRTIGFASFFGGNRVSSYNRTIAFHIIENLGNVVSSETIPFIILNAYDDNKERTYNNAPLRLEIDPIDGQLLFIDIFAASIFKVFFSNIN